MEDRTRRRPNFTYQETSLLLELVDEHKHIVESKKGDSTTRSEKEKCWDLIAMQFNEECGLVYRDKKVLKGKFDNLKKMTKRKVGEEKKSIGGEPSKDAPKYTPIEDKVKEILGNKSFPPTFNNDTPMILSISDGVQEDDDEDRNQEKQFRAFTVENLRKLTSFPLQPMEDPENLTENSYDDLLKDSDKRMKQSSSISSLSEKRLKQYKSRPYTKPGREREIWDDVGNAELELLKIQREIALEELKMQRRRTKQVEEEHQLKIKHLEEEHNLKIKVLEKELKKEQH